MRIYSFLLFTFFVHSATILTAREYHLRGKVLDANTKEPIPYTTILVKNTVYGAQANEHGDFSLTLPHGYENDTLCVRMLSYKEKFFAVNDIEPNMLISLTPTEMLLDEVVIYATNPEDILRKASENWEKNHKAETSQVQRCFYRELFFENGICFRVGEGIVDDYDIQYTPDSTVQKKKILLARGIQDSTKLRWINDVFRFKKDTISFDALLSSGLSGVDLVSFLNSDTTKNKDDEQEKHPEKRKKKKGMGVTIKLDKEVKYGGLVKHNNRSSHRIIVTVLAKKTPIFKGQVLIDSATYAYAGIQISNQRLDLYKELVPWYAKMAVRIMGYKPQIKELNYSCLYHIQPDEKWVKSYDYMRYGGAVTKKRQTLDGYIQNEFFYYPPLGINPNDSIEIDKDFKETIVTSFDNDEFWIPYKVPVTPQRVKAYTHQIHERNQGFEGSIGYNKKESRKRRRAARRKKNR